MGKIETNLSAAEVGHHIGGAIRSGMSAATATSTTRRLARCTQGRAGGRIRRSTRAVQAAKAAFPVWADTPPIRGRGSSSFLELMNQHKAALAAAITAEHGKVFTGRRGRSVARH